MLTGPLTEDFGNQVKAIPDQWGVCLYCVTIDDFGNDIRPQALALIERMGHRGHTLRRSSLKLIDEVDYAGKFVYDIIEFTLLQLESSE